MHFQPAIPQLPIPTLQDTCQRYLATQGAFLSQEEFEETKAIVEEFERGEGHGGLRFHLLIFYKHCIKDTGVDFTKS